MKFPLAAAALTACVPAFPAAAQDYDGAPAVQAESTASSGKASAAAIRASADIAAPPSVVWAALTDCAGAPRFMPKLISCKIIEKGPQDRWEIREHRLEGGLFKREMRNVFRADFTPPSRLTFHRVAGDWKKSEGEWRLTPLDGGKGTRVAYRTEVAVDGPVPVSWVRAAVIKGMPQSMLALRREAVARNKAASPAR